MQEREIAVDTLCMIFWDFCYYLEIGNTSLVDALINADEMINVDDYAK